VPKAPNKANNWLISHGFFSYFYHRRRGSGRLSTPDAHAPGAGVPQLAQNFATPISLPQPVQNFFAGAARDAPHSAQNFPTGT
jgi:hypothetical protein